ncbi:jmjC domain-containing histone demethylation protein 1-like [Schistocerca cancellata]|uniref:jmjC domain-containing histone demethylation protein 1-like n=1 Tax=Schistocerca cancellata TaxID=274614 RepID=UPI0021197F11|nr:jmjC domain-containing histone demethylation protein 1-like [Schistocerca cancellata]
MEEASKGEGHRDGEKREGGPDTGGKPQLSTSKGESQDAGSGGGGSGSGSRSDRRGQGSTSGGVDQPSPSQSITPQASLSLSISSKLARELVAGSTKQLRRPTHVVRPAPSPPVAAPVTDPVLHPTALVKVFRFLSLADLGHCALVCKAWSRASIDPQIWRRIDLPRRRPSASLLAGIVRRQPGALLLNWMRPPLTKQQLAWLIVRLPQLRELSLQGFSWTGISALRSCTCPPLSVLDLSFVSGFNDVSLRELLSPPPDMRPGLVGSPSRLKGLHTLRLAGCDISDMALRYIAQHLPKLVELDVSQCIRVTDAGVAQLATPPATTISTLASLDLSSCRLLTDSSLDHLAHCDALVRLDLRQTPNVTDAALAKFAEQSRHGLHVIDTKVIVKKKTSSESPTTATSPQKTST